MFLDLIEKRRSIRKYKKASVEKEKISQLVEAALRSPSSKGITPWEFIVITDKTLLEKLSKAKPHGSSFLKNAPLGILVCANIEKSDVWVEDASIASIFIHLEAESLGLGSCWIQIRKRMYSKTKTSGSYIADILKLPTTMKVESIIAIGYPDMKLSPHLKEKLRYDKVHWNYFGQQHK